MDIPMSWDIFLCCIKQMKAMSDELQDGWEIQELTGVENGVYLTKKIYMSLSRTLKNATTSTKDTTITTEYHIAFSCTYLCPVLCFNAWKNDGAQISLEEWWDYTNMSLSEDKYNMLTQLDHPVLKKPYLMLHPCKTTQFIADSFKFSKNKVVSWLSVMGPVMGLCLLTEYEKLTY